MTLLSSMSPRNSVYILLIPSSEEHAVPARTRLCLLPGHKMVKYSTQKLKRFSQCRLWVYKICVVASNAILGKYDGLSQMCLFVF